jgi:uncharacterized protein YndB with AHSA1/START domain
MSLDPAAMVGLVTREVRSGSRDGAPTKIVIARRTYPTGQADLWNALTSPDRIARWFLPVSGDLKAGGRYQLEGNAGGIIQRCAAPESFAVTWEFRGTMSWLEVRLVPDGERTTLQLAHEAPVDPGMWGQFGPGAVGVGWDLGLIGLGLHIESGAPVDPAMAVTFPASPEGAEFIRRAAEGWADAAVRDSDEPGQAHEAAARTVAFYTPPPEAARGNQQGNQQGN